jgi:hypothetical protein
MTGSVMTEASEEKATGGEQRTGLVEQPGEDMGLALQDVEGGSVRRPGRRG